jgi:allophanate hydrolase subunit 1
MAERVMSTLNLALQNVSLAREEMDPELEALIRHKTNLAQLREAIDRSPRLPVAYCDSMSPVIARLAERFNQMKILLPVLVLHLMKKLVNASNCFRIYPITPWP